MVAISDGGKLERLARVTAPAEASRTVEELCARIIDGQSVKAVAKDWGLPRHRFEVWLAAEPERAAMVEAAHRFRAADLVAEALEVADEQHMVEKAQGGEYDPDVPRDALRVKTRLAIAGFFDRKRFGAQSSAPAASVRVIVDRSCGVSSAGARVENETTAVAVDLGVL